MKSGRDGSGWPTHRRKARRARRTADRIDEVEPAPWWIDPEAVRPPPVSRKAKGRDQLGA